MSALSQRSSVLGAALDDAAATRARRCSAARRDVRGTACRVPAMQRAPAGSQAENAGFGADFDGRRSGARGEARRIDRRVGSRPQARTTTAAPEPDRPGPRSQMPSPSANAVR